MKTIDIKKFKSKLRYIARVYHLPPAIMDRIYAALDSSQVETDSYEEESV